MDFREFRLKHNMTQMQMAREFGVCLGTLIKWENDVGNPNEKNQKKIDEVVKRLEGDK